MSCMNEYYGLVITHVVIKTFIKIFSTKKFEPKFQADSLFKSDVGTIEGLLLVLVNFRWLLRNLIED